MQDEAKLFVTRFVRVLFGAVSTTKMHRLGFHLMEELLQRGNFEEADTSVNEMLHKLLKAMYRVTNKHPDNFEVQMMKCEQTLLHILAEDAEAKLRESEEAELVNNKVGDGRLRRKDRRLRTGAPRGDAVNSCGVAGRADQDDLGYDTSDESEFHVGYVNGDDKRRTSSHTTDDASVDGRGAARLGADAVDVPRHDSCDESGYETCTSSEGDGAGAAVGRRGNDHDNSRNWDADTCDDASHEDEVTNKGASTGADSIWSSSKDGLSNGGDDNGSNGSGATRSGRTGTTSCSFTTATCSSSGSNARSTVEDAGASAASAAVERLRACRRGRKRAARPLVAGSSRLVKRARASQGTCQDTPTLRKGVRVRGKRISVADAAGAHGGRLLGLAEALGALDTQVLTVTNSMAFNASFEWGAKGFVQRVRAAPSLYNGSPWWDHVLFTDATSPAGRPRLGLARLIIRVVDGERRDLVLVQLLKEADARHDCVLTEFGCGRRRWEMDARTGFPALAIVSVANLRRLEHVVPDFEDFCDRLALYATPATVPDTPQELPLQRFFVNAFFPWTGGCEDEES